MVGHIGVNKIMSVLLVKEKPPSPRHLELRQVDVRNVDILVGRKGWKLRILSGLSATAPILINYFLTIFAQTIIFLNVN